MRLWSLHPKLLDQKGLGAAWREGLLAQSVIVKLQAGQKPGYANHPQLARFLATEKPLDTLGAWLLEVYKEAVSRGYAYDRSKILRSSAPSQMTVTLDQLEYEFEHLQAKLERRLHRQFKVNELKYQIKNGNLASFAHPLFKVVSGPIESWEKVK